MESFYGGPAGQSFTIKEVFPTYTAMQDDAAKGWNSNIAVGEFVMVSYGIPGGSEDDKTKYESNLNTDKQKGNYNATLYQKEYHEPKPSATSTGMSYKLIASLMGPAPNITAANVTWVGPEEELKPEDASVTGTYPDDLTLNLSLPRAVKFFYGQELGLGQDYENQGEKDGYKDALTGDYYINTNSGWVYYITKDGEKFNFAKKACFQPTFKDTASVELISPYDENLELIKTGSASLSQDKENQQWQFSFELPSIPVFDVGDISLVEDRNEVSVGTSVKDANTLQFAFTLPAGTKIFCGEGEPPSDQLNNEKGALYGDYYLNTKTGDLYQFNNRFGWDTGSIVCNLQGPTGEPLSFYAKEDYSGESFKASEIIDYLAENYPDIEKNQIIKVFCTALNEYYWFYKSNDGWDYVLVTGGISSLLQDAYDKNGSTEKAYTVKYINDLLLNTHDGSDLTTKVYTVKYINDLLLNKRDDDNNKEIDLTTKTYAASYINGLADQIAENKENIGLNAESISQNEGNINTVLSELKTISKQLTSISNQLESTWGEY